jgi:hypothetical protein
MSTDQLRERMAYPASRSMMMVVIAAVVMVVAMSMIAGGSGVIVGMAHGIGGIREMPSLYDICACVNICN